MPTVKRFDRCRIEMYFGDHPPPRDIAEAFAWARENRAVLSSRWQAYSEDES